MIKPNIWFQVKILDKEGYSKSEIARLLGINRKTVRKAISHEKPLSCPARENALSSTLSKIISK